MVPLNPHLITRKQLRVVGSWGFAENHYFGHIRDLPRLTARFDLTRLITRYNYESQTLRGAIWHQAVS